jgi:hypothetical protein
MSRAGRTSLCVIVTAASSPIGDLFTFRRLSLCDFTEGLKIDWREVSRLMKHLIMREPAH